MAYGNRKARPETIKSTPAPGASNARRRQFCVAAALVGLGLVVFLQVRDFEFLEIDDQLYVTKNPNVAGGVTMANLVWAFTSGHATNWHPITWISHMLDVDLFGLGSGGHHLTSLALHLVNGVLLFHVLTVLTGTFWESAFVAAVFLVHPLDAESVAWVAERKNVLSTLFWFLTLLSYAAYARAPAIGRYGWVALWLAMGLMSKPMLVTVPVILFLLDLWPLRRPEPVTRLVLEKMPLLGLSIISSVITVLVQRGGGAMAGLESMPLMMRLENAPVSLILYLKRMVWPTDLAFFYPHPKGAHPLWLVGVSAASVALISIAALSRAGRRRPYLAVGWFWYLITLLPVIGIIQVGRQAMADRYTYVPLIGVYLALTWWVSQALTDRPASETPALGAAERLIRPHRRAILCVTASALLLAISAAGRAHVSTWRNSLSLYGQAVRVTENNYLAHYNLANALFAEGRMEEAIKHYQETIRIKSMYYPAAHFNFGYLLSRQGRADEAIEQYRLTIQMVPDHKTAHNNLGKLLYQKGEVAEARGHFEEALRIQPENAEAHNNLGNVLAVEGNLSDAERHYREALRIQPSQTDAHFNLGNALARQGRLTDAERHFLEALRINPAYEPAKKNLEAVRNLMKSQGR